MYVQLVSEAADVELVTIRCSNAEARQIAAILAHHAIRFGEERNQSNRILPECESGRFLEAIGIAVNKWANQIFEVVGYTSY